MNNLIKGVGIDLDGTLLKKDQTISEANKQALIECLDRGIQIYFVTGRPYSITKMLADSVDDRIKIICYNGGFYQNNTPIEKVIHTQALHEFIDCIADTKAHAFFKGKSEYFTHESYDSRFLYDHLNPSFPKENQVVSYTDLSWTQMHEKCHDILKVLVYDFDEVALKTLRERVEKIKNLEVTSYQAISFDVNAYHVNKGTTLDEVFLENGWTKDNFMAIGDSENDIAMFQHAGFKVAMGNALESLKAMSDAVTLSNEFDGVSNALRTYLFN